MKIFFLIVVAHLTNTAPIQVHEAFSGGFTGVIKSTMNAHLFACLQQCFDPAMKVQSSYWTFEDIAKTKQDICNSQKVAISCIKDNFYCAYKPEIFNKAARYLDHRCELQDQLYSKVKQCLKPNIGRVMLKCEAECSRIEINFERNNFHDYGNEEYINNVTKVTEGLENTCGHMHCLLPCVESNMNSVCKGSGSYTLTALMENLTSMTFAMEVMETMETYHVLQKLDPRCHFLLNRRLQDTIRRGDFSAFNNKKRPASFGSYLRDTLL